MNASSEPVGTLETALAHTQSLMTSEPRLAAEQATEILKVAPGHPLATLLLGVAQRRSGDAAASQAVLEPLAHSQPNWAAAHHELGLTRGVAARWRGRRRRLAACRESQARDAGCMARARRSPHRDRRRERRRRRLRPAHQVLDPRSAPDGSRRGARARTASRRRRQLLRAHLKQYPTDVPAIRMLAEVAARLGPLCRRGNAAGALPRARAGLRAARHNYAADPAPPAASPEPPGAGRQTARGRSAQPELPQPQGRDPQPHRRLRRGARALRGRARRVSAATRGCG